MPVFFAVIGTPLYDFAAGCVLAANVYSMIRGGKNYLKGRKSEPFLIRGKKRRGRSVGPKPTRCVASSPVPSPSRCGAHPHPSRDKYIFLFLRSGVLPRFSFSIKENKGF